MHAREQKQIIRGSSVSLTIVVRSFDGDALDLSTATQITVRMRKQDRSALVKTLSDEEIRIVSPYNGRISLDLASSETEGLYAMQNAPIEVWVDFGTIRRIAQIKSGVSVIDRLI